MDPLLLKNPNLLNPACPWYGYEIASLLTCEERLCSWIRQPANTFSSLIFFLVAAFLLVRGKKLASPMMQTFSYFSMGIGGASILAHAGQLRFFVFLDFTSQALLFVYLFSFNCWQLNWITGKKAEHAIIFIASALVVIMQLANRNSAHLSFALTLLPLLISEILWIQQNKPDQKHLRTFYISLVFLVAGGICFVLDVSELTCSPKIHWFQFHALFHVLAALSLGFAAHYYYFRQTFSKN